MEVALLYDYMLPTYLLGLPGKRLGVLVGAHTPSQSQSIYSMLYVNI